MLNSIDLFLLKRKLKKLENNNRRHIRISSDLYSLNKKLENRIRKIYPKCIVACNYSTMFENVLIFINNKRAGIIYRKEVDLPLKNSKFYNEYYKGKENA